MTIVGAENADASNPISEAHSDELIPGIKDCITLTHITTKLPWRDVHVLSFVSHDWHQAMEVYRERVCCNLAETFVCIHRNRISSNAIRAISLCSIRDRFCHTLPQVDDEHNHDVRLLSHVLTLDGKVYKCLTGGNLHVLDLAREPQWKQCAFMNKQIQRSSIFDSGVMDGKIYIFGSGVSFGPQDLLGTMVYNPKQNRWSPRKSMPRSVRLGYKVAAVGDELVVYGGVLLVGRGIEFADLLQVYHPVKDEWRVVESLAKPQGHIFVARSRFYTMGLHDIHVYDFHGNSWSHLHSFSFAASELVAPAMPEVVEGVVHSGEIEEFKAIVVGDELLASVKWPNEVGSSLFRSRGFGGPNKQLLWQELEFSFPFDRLSTIHPIHY
ncbi:unnamed protein product [Calypogeia fissa]